MKQVQTTVVSSRPYLRNRTTCSNLKSPFLSSVKENRDTVWCCSKQAKALSYLSPSTSSCGQVTMPEPLKSNIVKHLWNAIWGLYKKTHILQHWVEKWLWKLVQNHLVKNIETSRHGCIFLFDRFTLCSRTPKWHIRGLSTVSLD